MDERVGSESLKNMSLCDCGIVMIGCKYAVEEALKTATALNKRGPFIHYNASIVFSTMGVVS